MSVFGSVVASCDEREKDARFAKSERGAIRDPSLVINYADDGNKRKNDLVGSGGGAGVASLVLLSTMW